MAVNVGRIDNGLRAATHVREGSYAVAYQSHASFGPSAGVAIALFAAVLTTMLGTTGVAQAQDPPNEAQILIEEWSGTGLLRTGSGPIRRVRSWKTDMPPEHIEIFEAIAGDVLSELGFERMFPSPSLSAKLKARAGIAGAPVAKIRSLTR